MNNSHAVIQGQFVNQKVSQVVEAIKEYEPDIDVEWVPPGARTDRQAAYKIVYRPVGQPEFILFHVDKDEDFDERVLMRIIANDQRNGEVSKSEYEAWEEAQRRVKHQEFLDELEEASDIARHVFKSPLHNYKVNKDLVIKEGLPFNAAHLDSNNQPIRGSNEG